MAANGRHTFAYAYAAPFCAGPCTYHYSNAASTHLPGILPRHTDTTRPLQHIAWGLQQQILTATHLPHTIAYGQPLALYGMPQ